VSSLRLENVAKRFGGLLAVSEVTLEVPRGTITGLIGPNGAGKSTVVNLIAGMLKLTEGRILLGQTDISEDQPEQIARRGISRTFQNIRLLPEASVLENVMIGFHRRETASLVAGLLGLPASLRESRDIAERAAALLDRFRMGDYAGLPAGGLAYGHQRRVEIMRAAASDPEIILLDEPVAGMNDVEAEELGVIFSDLAGRGIGLLLIEHNIRFVTKLCPMVHVLDTGRMIASGPPEIVTRDPAVIAAYLGDAAA
jgi:branched-chain amino acid transport system ATP-binding protein